MTIEAGPNKGQTCTFVDTYVWPTIGTSGVGSQGRAWKGGTITVYRVNGELYAPKADYKLTLPIDGVETDVRINSANPRLNADEALNVGVYDLEVATT